MDLRELLKLETLETNIDVVARNCWLNKRFPFQSVVPLFHLTSFENVQSLHGSCQISNFRAFMDAT